MSLCSRIFSVKWSGPRFQIGMFFRGAALFLFVLPAAVFANESPSENSKSPDEICSQLKEWAERITNIRVVWESTSYDFNGQLKQGETLLSNRKKKEWVWCRDGRWRSHVITHLNDRLSENELEIDSTKFHYVATYPTAEAPLKFPYTLSLSRSRIGEDRNRMGSSNNIPLKGQWNPFELNWLGERLSNPDRIQTWSQEKVGGRVLPVVEIQDEPWSPVCVLDPDFGYQPRIVRSGADYVSEEYRVEEFQEIEPGFWLAFRGTYRVESPEYPELNEVRRWAVKEAQINVSFDDSYFEIRPVTGTFVEDHISDRTFRFGPEMPPDTMENGLNRKFMAWADSGFEGPNPFSPPKSVSPWKRWTPVLLIVGLFVCFGILGLSIYLRMAESAESSGNNG